MFYEQSCVIATVVRTPSLSSPVSPSPFPAAYVPRTWRSFRIGFRNVFGLPKRRYIKTEYQGVRLKDDLSDRRTFV